MHGNVLRTANHTWAWFGLPTLRWSYRDDASREAMITNLADALGEIGQLWCHLRVTSRPSPISEWAGAYASGTGGRRLPDTAGALSWREFLLAEQRSLSGWALTDKQVFLGVNIGARSGADRATDHAPAWMRRRVPELFRAEMAAMDDNLTKARRAVASLGGWEASAAEMDWLMHRSFCLGLPTAPPEARAVPSGFVDTTDLVTYPDEATMWQEPQAPTVTVHALDGSRAQASVAILSLGNIEAQQIPQVDLPWMYQPELLGIPHEWSVRFRIRPAEDVRKELTFQANKARSQISHHVDDHHIPAPAALERQAKLAQRVEDELSSATLARSNRIVAYFRLAVAGDTEDTAIEQAHRVAECYRPKIRVEHTEAQYAHAREFRPGEGLAAAAHQRRGSLTWLASAMPQVSNQVGDRRGPILGRLAQGPPRLVAWDPWLSMEERDSSGLAALLGALGSGKTLLAIMLIYKTLRTGAEWTILDPSGRAGKLAALPELRDYARVIDLLNATLGMLNPYRVVPEPRREHFAAEPDPDKALAKERQNVAMIRHDMTISIMKGILSANLQNNEDTDIVLDTAAAVIEDHPDPHPGRIIDTLRQAHDLIHDERLARHAQLLGEHFDRNRAKLRPLIPDGDADPYGRETDHRLTVLSMAGLVLPTPGSRRADWKPQELFNMQLLELAAWLTQRNLYNRPLEVLKGLFIDEAWFLSAVPQGQALIDRINHDSRKHHIRALLASQVPSELLQLPGFASLVDAVFLGRLYGRTEQSKALELAGIPTDAGYEAQLTQLPIQGPRQFLFADGTGQIERIVADFSAPHLAHVMAAADTTPTRTLAEPTAGDTGDTGDGQTDQPGPVDGFAAAQQTVLDKAAVDTAGGLFDTAWSYTGHLPETTSLDKPTAVNGRGVHQ
jgi:hypothetical protein